MSGRVYKGLTPRAMPTWGGRRPTIIAWESSSPVFGPLPTEPPTPRRIDIESLVKRLTAPFRRVRRPRVHPLVQEGGQDSPLSVAVAATPSAVGGDLRREQRHYDLSLYAPPGVVHPSRRGPPFDPFKVVHPHFVTAIETLPPGRICEQVDCLLQRHSSKFIAWGKRDAAMQLRGDLENHQQRFLTITRDLTGHQTHIQKAIMEILRTHLTSFDLVGINPRPPWEVADNSDRFVEAYDALQNAAYNAYQAGRLSAENYERFGQAVDRGLFPLTYRPLTDEVRHQITTEVDAFLGISRGSSLLPPNERRRLRENLLTRPYSLLSDQPGRGGRQIHPRQFERTTEEHVRIMAEHRVIQGAREKSVKSQLKTILERNLRLPRRQIRDNQETFKTRFTYYRTALNEMIAAQIIGAVQNLLWKTLEQTVQRHFQARRLRAGGPPELQAVETAAILAMRACIQDLLARLEVKEDTRGALGALTAAMAGGLRPLIAPLAITELALANARDNLLGACTDLMTRP